MSNYDSWDFEPAPEQDNWDTWDTGASSGAPEAPASSLWTPPGNSKGGYDDGKGYGKSDFGGFDSFGKGDFGKGDFGKGGFGKGGKNDFDKGFGKSDFGKGGFDGGFDGGKGNFGKGDFGKGGFGKDKSGKGKGFDGKGKDFGFKGKDLSDMGPPMSDMPPMSDHLKGVGPGKGAPENIHMPGMVAQSKRAPAAGLVPQPPPMDTKGMPPMGNKGMPQKGFDGGKGGFAPVMPPNFKGGPMGPGPQPGPPGGPPPPPPGGMPMLPPNGNLPPFAPGQPMGLAPELLALTEAEHSVTLIDDAIGSKAAPAPEPKKQRLFLLLTRLAPDLQSEHVLQILEQCGEVQGFRRARDPTGKPLSFGFALFADPEAAWKASTCISKLVLNGQEIKVLLEEQTETQINLWRNAQQAALKVNSNEELEWELERKTVSCKVLVEGKVEEIFGSTKGGGAASTRRREELRKREQARVLRVRKRKAWREEQFAKELERVESLEKRMRREERSRDGMDRKKEQLSAPREKDSSDLSLAKKEEFGDDSGGALAVVGNDERVLTDLVDRIQSESREYIFKLEIDVKFLREEKIFEKKLRPWLERQINIRMGGQQSDLVEYMLRRVNSGTSAEALISDLMKYLDDGTEALVERMWRMMIFELMRSGHLMDGYRR